jgi:two-component system, NarL family, response regulator DevR
MTRESTIRVMLIDDHGIVRQGLRSILELDPGIRVVGEADDPETALPLLESLQPDIVLLDLSIGQHGTARGLQACQTISQRFSQIGVIVLTTFLEERLVLQALQNGAKGYVLKDVDATDLIRMIRAVSRGEAAIDTRITPLVLKNLGGRASERSSLDLTDREKEVIRLLASGLSNRQIGLQLHISESTVKYHLRNIMDKLDVRARTEIVYAASKLGLV